MSRFAVSAARSANGLATRPDFRGTTGHFLRPSFEPRSRNLNAQGAGWPIVAFSERSQTGIAVRVRPPAGPVEYGRESDEKETIPPESVAGSGVGRRRADSGSRRRRGRGTGRSTAEWIDLHVREERDHHGGLSEHAVRQ